VNLDPSSPDFLKIRAGRYRYDPLAGFQQVMRLVYRTGADLTRAALGEKSEQGENALDVAERFLRQKLAPVLSYFIDFAARRTVTGEPFEAGRGAFERVIPIIKTAKEYSIHSASLDGDDTHRGRFAHD
jgi:hypothetical protein